jgi:hypothetical protein
MRLSIRDRGTLWLVSEQISSESLLGRRPRLCIKPLLGIDETNRNQASNAIHQLSRPRVRRISVFLLYVTRERNEESKELVRGCQRIPPHSRPSQPQYRSSHHQMEHRNTTLLLGNRCRNGFNNTIPALALQRRIEFHAVTSYLRLG